MKRRRLGALIGLAMLVQLATTGIAWANSAVGPGHGAMCGGGSGSFRSSAAYRNALKEYGSIPVELSHEPNTSPNGEVSRGAVSQ